MRILIADRHPEERGSSESILRQAGHATAVVHDACSLLAAARRGVFDVFVLRLQSPPTEDLLAYQSLRSDGELAHVPVIFCIESETDPADAAAAFAAGADHVLVEPLERERLLAAVETSSRTLVPVPPRTWTRRLPDARASHVPRGQRAASARAAGLERDCTQLIAELLRVVDALRTEFVPIAHPGARERLEELVQRAHRKVELFARRSGAAEFDWSADS